MLQTTSFIGYSSLNTLRAVLRICDYIARSYDEIRDTV